MVWCEKISKITFNSLKRSTKKTKTGKPIWVWQQPKGKGQRPTISQIKQFRALRTKASKKRERARRKFIKSFKFHETESENITFTTYCIEFNNGKGITDLQKLFKTLGLAKKLSSKHRIRFFPGSWNATCLDDSAGCPPTRRFIALTKLGGDKYIDKDGKEQTSGDKYDIGRNKPLLTNDNFTDTYLNYLIVAIQQAGGIYLSNICPRCPSGSLLIEWIKICFQVIKVRP